MNKLSDEQIIRFLNGKMNKDEIIDFEKMINSSEENMKLFEACRKIWLGTAAHLSPDNFNSQEAWEKVVSKMHDDRSERGVLSNFRHNRLLQQVLRIAAMFILFVSFGAACGWYIFSSKTTKLNEQYCEIVAPQGSKSLITLPDGSTAWINAGSKLSYRGDFNHAERIVTLEGEGYFSVKSNKAIPFIVQTAYLKVKAFGTVFNVKAYPEEKTIETTLVEGIVEIEADAKTKSAETFTYTLKPKQNIIYHIDSGLTEQQAEKAEEKELIKTVVPQEIEKEVQVKSNIKPELYTSWKDENWVIEGVPLDELAVLMGRRYNTKIDIQDNALKMYKFTGTIQNETLEQVLFILRLTTPLEYQIGKGNVAWELDRNLQKNYTRILKR